MNGLHLTLGTQLNAVYDHLARNIPAPEQESPANDEVNRAYKPRQWRVGQVKK